MSCGELFLKSASSTFTGYFLIVSLAFIIYGITSTYLILISISEEILAEEHVGVPSLSLIFFGGVLFLLIVLGCCAVCREIPCCLETYSIFLSVLASMQIGVGIFALVRFSITNAQFAERIRDDVTKMFLTYQDQPKDMDNVQSWLYCCGIDGPRDWVGNGSLPIPNSCCKVLEDDTCNIFSSGIFPEGCAYAVWRFVCSTNYMIGWSLIIVGVTEVIGAMLGISLSCAFWRNSRVLWI